MAGMAEGCPLTVKVAERNVPSACLQTMQLLSCQMTRNWQKKTESRTTAQHKCRAEQYWVAPRSKFEKVPSSRRTALDFQRYIFFLPDPFNRPRYWAMQGSTNTADGRFGSQATMPRRTTASTSAPPRFPRIGHLTPGPVGACGF